jgi:iron complex transport system permease protein
MVVLLFIISLSTGSAELTFTDILKYFSNALPGQKAIILNEIRIPKAITAILAGTALSVSGLQMQTIFRNPLAGPYLLGISSGASLGVAILTLGITPFFSSQLPDWLLSAGYVVAAWTGAFIILALIMLVSLRIKDILTILILGILFAGIASAVIVVLQYTSNPQTLKSYVVWTMGGLGNTTMQQVKILAPLVILTTLLTFTYSKALNTLLLGEEYALSLGTRIKRNRILVFLTTGLLAGAVTAFCGPIGFVGIVIPHLGRMFFSTSDHRILIPSIVLMGSAIMLLSDILTQIPGNGRMLPVNAVTALIGIPIIIWILLKRKIVKM